MFSSNRSYVGLLGAVAIVGLITACPGTPPARHVDLPGAGPGDHGLLTPYTLTFRHFSNRETITITRSMAEELPGYRSHNLIARSVAVSDYEYLSTAKVFKLEEWLYILLWNMGFDADRDILIQVDGIHIVVDKLVPSPSRPVPNERRRFS